MARSDTRRGGACVSALTAVGSTRPSEGRAEAPGFPIKYPEVLSEDATLDLALAGRSVARVGEGELRVAIGWPIKSQVYNPRLMAEMRRVLTEPSRALICLPRVWAGMPAEAFWRQFGGPKYSHLYRPGTYGSAFISRSDVANGIDRPDYWAKVTDLWRGKDVVLVSRSTKVLNLSEAASVQFVECPAVGAYADIDRIEAEIGQPTCPVLLVLGATATVLAVRLANKGVYALDLGHMGSFMVAAGVYSMERQALISDAYIEQNRMLHKGPEAYGASGHKRRDEVMAYAAEVGAEGVLDYGSGKGTLKTAMAAAGFRYPIANYDPAIKGVNGLPKPADLVVCSDVLEHVEPEKLTAVLAHILRLAGKAAYLVIATRPARKSLPDKRNAHLIVRHAEWWIAQVEAAGFRIERQAGKEGHDLKLWCRT